MASATLSNDAITVSRIDISSLNVVKSDPKPCSYEGRICFPQRHQAEIVAEAVSTDAELRPELVDRHVYIDNSTLVIQVEATDVKVLRTAVTSFYDFIRVSIRTLAIVPQ